MKCDSTNFNGVVKVKHEKSVSPEGTQQVSSARSSLPFSCTALSTCWREAWCDKSRTCGHEECRKPLQLHQSFRSAVVFCSRASLI